MNNGKTKVILWLGGCLFTIIVCITLPALATNIIENDRKNTSERNRIRAEMKVDKEDLMKRMDLGFAEVRKEQKSLAIQFARIETLIKNGR